MAAPRPAPEIQNAAFWNQIWMTAQRKNIDAGRGKECWAQWADKDAAREYYRRSLAGSAAKKRAAELAALIGPESRVLDIGAGPGSIALLLAKKAAHITAVEPAAGMAEVFREQVELENADNVLLLNKRWEDVDAVIDLYPPYDLCFASFSLGMLDLQESIEKMIGVTVKHIVLYWHAGPQAFDEDAAALCPLLYGTKHSPVPESSIIFNLLYSMGIYPDVKVIRETVRLVYPSFDDVLAAYARRYDVQTQDQRRLLASYLKTKFTPYRGKSVIRFTGKVGMRISWLNQITTVTRLS
jgi:SAM-dependent methyltransferase